MVSQEGKITSQFMFVKILKRKLRAYISCKGLDNVKITIGFGSFRITYLRCILNNRIVFLTTTTSVYSYDRLLLWYTSR
jgi:hypothetical protein